MIGDAMLAQGVREMPYGRGEPSSAWDPLELEMRVSLVLPAHNEEANVQEAIAETTAVAERLFVEHEILVVDDGSSDRTAEFARAAARLDPRVRVIRHGRNRGYGEALRTGFL